MKILAADDDTISRMLLKTILEQSRRHQVTLATDGEEAWGLLNDQQNRYDVAILDVMMPHIDGIDLLHRIRQTPGLRALPVVLCTGASDRTTVERAAKLSANHYIVKPFTATVVLSKLEAVESDVLANQEIEDPAMVCNRLGIDAATRVVLIEALLSEVNDWANTTRTVTVSRRYDRMAMRANSLKGAAANLGLRLLSNVIDTAEKLLTVDSDQVVQAGFLLPEAELYPLIDRIDQLSSRIRSTLGAPSA